MTFEALLEEIRALPLSDRKRLIHLIVETLPGDERKTAHRSITELRGLGKSMWQGTDARQYVDALRSEWDEHGT